MWVQAVDGITTTEAKLPESCLQISKLRKFSHGCHLHGDPRLRKKINGSNKTK